MKIAIASDHAGYRYKEEIKKTLEGLGHQVLDFGTHSMESVDYPLFIRPAALAVARKEADRGIVLGGSGNGEAIVANRVSGVRCALCWNRESAILARQHNDANMISLGERLITLETALEIVRTWLAEPFEGGRHHRRIQQIDEPVPHHRESGAEKPASGKPTLPEFDVLITYDRVSYSEGHNSIEFRVEPGLKGPLVIRLPSPQSWASAVPEWARHRREEILERTKKKCIHLNALWKDK